MVLDKDLQLCSAQQVTADAVSENTFDAHDVTPKRQLAVGEPMGMVVAITAVGTHTGSVKVQAITSAAADLGSPLIVGELDLEAADAAVGRLYWVAISGGKAPLRYWGLNFDITGTVDFTVDAYGPMPLSMFTQLNQHYAKGYTV